jgi:hypothetical protein
MIGMTVAEEDGVYLADGVEIRPPPSLGPLSAIEQ